MIKPALELWIKGNLRKTILLNRSVTRVGRHDDNDIVLRNIGVSRHHAKIVDDAGVFTVHDLQSANGIIVNREPVEHAALAVGDEIGIGKFTLRFVTVESSRTDLAPGGYVLGEDTPAGPTFEVRGAMARKIRERFQSGSAVKPAAPAPDAPVVVATLAEDVDLGASASSGRTEYAVRAMREDEWLFEKALEPGEFLIGRSADNHIILAGANVSRRHAMLTVDDRGFIIEDLGSRNGIRVNGEAVERRGLTLGDEVTVGDFRLMLVQHDLIGEHALLEAEDLAAVEAGPETGDVAATANVGGTAPGFEIEHELRWQDPEPDVDAPIEAEIVSPEDAADQGGDVAFAYPLEDAEITVQLAGWTTTHAFQPESLRRATGSDAHEDRITVRVQLADGIRRFTFSVDDMETEDED